MDLLTALPEKSAPVGIGKWPIAPNTNNITCVPTCALAYQASFCKVAKLQFLPRGSASLVIIPATKSWLEDVITICLRSTSIRVGMHLPYRFCLSANKCYKNNDNLSKIP